MKKLTLILALLVAMVTTAMAQINVSQTEGTPEHWYYIRNANNVFATKTTNQAKNHNVAAGAFAFYDAGAGEENAYYIYSIFEEKWLTYTIADSYSDKAGFVDITEENANKAKFSLIAKEDGSYNIAPYKTSGVASIYLNWYGGGDNKLGIYGSNTDNGSKWFIEDYVPKTSTKENRIYYYIKNVTSNKYVNYTYKNSVPLKQIESASYGSFWYFVEATDANQEQIPEGAVACRIYNAGNDAHFENASSGYFDESGQWDQIWIIRKHTKDGHIGFGIHRLNDENHGWNNKNGSGEEISNYSYNDGGSIFRFFLVNQADADNVLNQVTSNLLNHFDYGYYYSTTDANVAEIKETINNLGTSTVNETVNKIAVTAKSIQNATGSGKAPQAGDIIQFRNRAQNKYLKDNNGNLGYTTNAWEFATYWELVEGENGVKIKNFSTNKFIGGIAQSQATALVDEADAKEFVFTNQDYSYATFKVHDGGNMQYAHYSNGNLVGWNNTAEASQWVIDKADFPVDGKHYIIESSLAAFSVTKAVYATDDNPKWGTLDKANKAYYWTAENVVNSEGVITGIALKNASTGEYMQDTQNAGNSEVWTMGEDNTARALKYEKLTHYKGKSNEYSLTNRHDMHARGHSNGTGNGDNVISYDNGTNANSASSWRFVEIADIDSEIRNIAYTQLDPRIEQLTEMSSRDCWTTVEAESITNALNDATATRNNTALTYDEIIATIPALDEVIKLKYIINLDNLSNNVCYAVSAENRGSWVAQDEHLDGTTRAGITVDIKEQNQQFAFIKSDKSGNYYLYSIGKSKFVSRDGQKAVLTDGPVQTIQFLAGTKNSADNPYHWVIALNATERVSHMGVSNGFNPAIITHNNDLKDEGNNSRIEKVAAFDPTNALAKISTYETNAIKAELLEKIGEANEYSEKTYLPEDKRTGLSTAAATAKDVYDDANATYDAVVEQIEIIEDLLNHCVYVTSPEGFSNNAIYTIVAKYNNGNAYVMWNANQGDNGNYAISSSKNFGTTIETGADVPGCQWAFYTSESGKHYLYNIGAGKFMGTSNEGNGYIPLNEKPTSADLILKNSADNEYPIMFSVNNGAGVLNHNNGNSFPYGLLNWHSTTGWNDTSSASNVHKVTVVGALEEETLATIEELVEKYETVGVKQQELKTLLDNIHSGYYDAWANNGLGGWRINPGVNNYYQPEGDDNFVTAYNEARDYETSEDIAVIEAQIARMNGLVANLKINQPESGKYYRLRCTSGQRYLSSNTNDAGKLQMNGNDRIFYYDGGIMAYTAGRYVQLASGANNVTLAAIGTKTTATFVDGKTNKNQSGSYLIKISDRWLHGDGNLANSGESQPTNNDGYNWWLEEVTELPVTITAAGYATFYAPVAVEIPENVKAYTVTIANSNWATMNEITGNIPAGTGVILEGAEGVHNFAITSDDSVIEGNALEGTAAATYIGDDAYVLSRINVAEEGQTEEYEIGFYTAEKNQQSDTSWLNNSHKAYLPKNIGTSLSNSLRFSFGDTTAIEKVESRNEKEEIYDLTGRKLECINGAGIYIINGKKVLVK